MDRSRHLILVFAAGISLLGTLNPPDARGQDVGSVERAGADGPVLSETDRSEFAAERSDPAANSVAANGPLYLLGAAVAVEPDLFAGVEVSVLSPRLHSVLAAPVPLGSGAKLVQLPNARLDVTGAPRVEIGMFRSPDSFGEMILAYRFLAADGQDLFIDPAGGGPTSRRSRIDFQTFDLDFACNAWNPGWETSVRWQVGARLQVVFFDTKTESPRLLQQANNYFFGAGPHAALTVTKMFNDEVSLFGAVDLAAILGYNTDQNFAVTTFDPVNGTQFGTFADQQSAWSPSCSVQAGLVWTPEWLPGGCFRGGYQFEQWLKLGHVGTSHGSLSAQGFFMSCEWGF